MTKANEWHAGKCVIFDSDSRPELVQAPISMQVNEIAAKLHQMRISFGLRAVGIGGAFETLQALTPSTAANPLLLVRGALVGAFTPAQEHLPW